jgi:hypothetical protein
MDPAYIVDGVLTDGEAWVGIAHETLSLPAATVTWISTDDGQVGDFSQYMDLKIICYVRGTTASVNGNLCVQFNNDGTTNAYAYQNLRGNGASVVAQTGSYILWDASEMPGSSATANVFGATVIDLFDINSGKFKSGFAVSASSADANTSTSSFTSLYATTWKNQAAIEEIDIYSRNLGNFVAGCTFSLFGVLPRMVA